MKIVHVVNVRWWNAAAHYGWLSARALARRGHDLTLAGLSDSPALARAREAGLATVAVDPLNGRSPLDWFRARAALARLYAQGIDVATHFRAEGQVVTATLPRRRRPPVFLRARIDPRPTGGKVWDRWLYARRTDGLILPSRSARGAVLGLRLDDGRLRILPPALGREWERVPPPGGAIRRRLGIRGGDRAAGVFGRLDPVKGHETFVRAAAQVRRPGRRFTIAGEEFDVSASALATLARGLGLRTVVLDALPGRLLVEPWDLLLVRGRLPDPAGWMAAHDVGVVPSVGSEVIGRGTLEWMAVGRPVVASRVGALPEEVADRETGLLVPPGDPSALSAALQTLLADPARARRLGRAARARFLHAFTEDRLGADFERLYEDLLRRHHL